MPRSRRSTSSEAKAMPGVVGVLTGKELKADGIGNLICGWMIHSKDGSPMKMGAWSPLAVDRVRYVGDAVVDRGGRHQGPGARRRRGGRDHLQGTAVGHRRVEGDGQGPAANPSGGGKQPDLRLGARQCRRRPPRRSNRPRMSSSSTSSTTGWCRTRWSRAPPSATTTRARTTTPAGRPRRTRISRGW